MRMKVSRTKRAMGRRILNFEQAEQPARPDCRFILVCLVEYHRKYLNINVRHGRRLNGGRE
jgi:hypothetical protein